MRRGARIVALVLGVALIGAWGVGSSGETEAAWADREFGRTILTARVIDRPTISSCSYDPGVAGILLASITVVWSFPAGQGYVQPANVRFALSNNTASTTEVTVSPTPTGTVVANGFSSRLSLGILSGTLGGSYGVFVRTLEPSGWTSQPATALVTVNLLTLGWTCVVT